MRPYIGAGMVSNGYVAGLTRSFRLARFFTLSRARRLIIFSPILFSVAAAAAGFADSLHSLVFWRIVQGRAVAIDPGWSGAPQQFKTYMNALACHRLSRWWRYWRAGACSPRDWRAAGGNVRLALDIPFATLPVAVLTFIALSLIVLAERRFDDNGVSKITHLPLLTDRPLRFAT